MRYLLLFILLTAAQIATSSPEVRLKDLGRIEAKREVVLIGYGLVVGLSGTGDSLRSKATLQSLANTLERFGLEVDENDLSSGNVAAVMVTGELPPFSEPGDRIDLRVSSTSDARSLAGGNLLLTPLYGPDDKLYVLGQGALTVGGYHVESYANSVRKNHTTTGQVSNGGSVERSPPTFGAEAGVLNILLDEPDYTTANRVVQRIQETFSVKEVYAEHPGKIRMQLPDNAQAMPFIAALENITVSPDVNARLVINGRTGTIVAGGNVTLNEVSIAHGNLRIEIQTDFNVSQPDLLLRPGAGVRTAVVPDTSISVVEDSIRPVQMPAGTTVAELVHALYNIRVSTRDTISILEAIKAAGALHADLIIQ